MSELEFPELDTAAPAASTALAEQPAGAVDMAKLDLQAVALAQFGAAHAAAKAATEKLTGVVHDLSTPTKLADAKSLRHRLINVPLADARKVSAGLKSKLTAVSRAVGTELAAIETAFQTAENLITPQIDEAQAKLDEEARIRREAEAARVQKHRDNLAKLAEPAERCRQPGMTAERIANGIAAVSAIVIDRAAWEDFADQAEEQKAVTLERMQALHAAAVATEAEAERIAAEKAEQERKAAELAAMEAKLAAERAELDRQKAELAAQQQAAAAEAQAKADEAARLEREQREEAERQARERSERAEAAAQTAGPITPEQGSQQVLKAEAPEPDATERDTPASQGPSVGSMGVRATADAAPSVASSPDVRPFHPGAAALRGEAEMLKLGELWDVLGLTDREAFLAGLGFPATPAAKGTGKLYLQSALPAICLAIADHFTALAGQKKAA